MNAQLVLPVGLVSNYVNDLERKWELQASSSWYINVHITGLNRKVIQSKPNDTSTMIEMVIS